MMDVAYYWIVGLMIGLGIGGLLPEWVQLTCAVIGFIMSVGTIGWYGHKMWAGLDEEGE